MATANPFDLLGDDDTDDVSHLIALQQKKKAAEKPVVAAAPATKQLSKPAAVAKLPSKPAPPAQAVKEAKSESVRGGGRSGVSGGRGYGRRDGGGYNRDFSGNDTSFGNGERGGGGGGRGYGRRDGGGYDRDSGRNENSFSNSESGVGQGAIRETDSGRTFERRGGYGGFRGERRGGYSNSEEGEGDRVRRVFERRSGTGRGNEFKREGSGRNNWGSQTDELPQVNEEVTNEGEKDTEKPSVEFDGSDGNKEKSTNEPEVKEPEEMTLEEYEKVLEEKRKALEALKMEERKVEIDKELAAMQLLSSKKGSDDIFVKLGSDKDKRKEIAEKEEKAKKSLSINEFLKPAEGEKYYNSGGRGRGRGRGSRGGFGGSSGMSSYAEAPAIGDPSEFPTLGAK